MRLSVCLELNPEYAVNDTSHRLFPVAIALQVQALFLYGYHGTPVGTGVRDWKCEALGVAAGTGVARAWK